MHFFIVKGKYYTTVCTKTVGATLDILSDVNLCYAGHYQATQDIFRKNRKTKNKTCFRTLLYILGISYKMDKMTLTYMNKCIYVFIKIYEKFSKISAVGLVIISASFCLMRNWSGTRQIGIFLSRGKRRLRIFASQNNTAREFCVM